MFGAADAMQQALANRAFGYNSQQAFNYSQWQSLRNVTQGELAMLNAVNPYQNALAQMPISVVGDVVRSNRVISDMGFGGAESRPRSRRYANG